LRTQPRSLTNSQTVQVDQSVQMMSPTLCIHTIFQWNSFI